MRVFIAGLVLCAVAFCTDAPVDSPRESAIALARKAARAEKDGNDVQAYLYYAQASSLDPKSKKYAGKREMLRSRAARQSPPIVSQEGQQAAEPEHPVINPFDSLTEREMANARPMKDVASLRGKAGLQSFDLTGSSRVLFDKVTAAYGLEVVYDGDYPPNDPPIHFKIDPAGFHAALEYLQVATSSLIIPISSTVLMVAKDTMQKRMDLEQTISVSIPLPPISTAQELTEIAQVIRQTTNVEKIAWDSARSQIVIRDRISRVRPALALLDQLLSYRPEVVLDLEFIQVSSNDLKNYGFHFTDSFRAYYLGQILRSTVTPAGVANLLTFGGGKTLIGLGVAEAQAIFNQTVTNGNSLYQAQLRSVAGQQASLHVGDKFPILTAGFVGRVDPSQGQVFTPPPAFTFADLGLTLKVTPFVHSMGEVSLNVETSFEVLTGDSVNDIPIIGRRALNAQVRLRSGEWAVIGGIMGVTKSKAISGYPGLIQIPGLGYLFRKTSSADTESNVLIGLRPRLLSLPPDQIITQALRVGSDLRPYTPF